MIDRSVVQLAAVCLVAILGLGSAGTIRVLAQNGDLETQSLAEGLSKVASSATAILKGQARETVAVGPFTGPAGVTSSAEIVSILRTQLAKEGIETKATAAVRLQGSYKLSTVSSSAGQKLNLTLELVDPRGEVLKEFRAGAFVAGTTEIAIDNERDVLLLTQPSVDLPPNASPANRLNQIASSLDRTEDPPFIENGVVFARKARTSIGRYGVAILVDGKLLEPKLEEGLAMIEIPFGKAYEIVLMNDTKFSAAADVRIDGLSTFEFSEVRVKEPGPTQGRPAYTGWIVDPNQSATVPGWHRRDSGEGNISTFVVGRYAESAAALLDQKSELGTIHVVFSAAWPAGQQPPEELQEPSKVRGEPNSTIIGPSKTVQVKPVKMETGVPRASVTIRYSR